MSRPLLLALSSLLLLTACEGGEVPGCFDDRGCGTGNRCVLPGIGMTGTCEPCDPDEIIYDGADNDCDPSTRDRDLDGDGENSPQGGGADCNDEDPDVSSEKRELCEDGKDNDCDGQADEIDCNDRQEPSVTFSSPEEGATVFGTFDVVATVFDDVGIVSAQLFINNVPIAATRDFTPPVMTQTVTFTVDSIAEALVDGPAALRIELVDVAGKLGQASRMIVLDNLDPPVVTPISPNEGLSYGGLLAIEASTEDASGVERVELLLDGRLIATSTQPPHRTVTDTSTLADGPATVTIRAVDARGNETSSDVSIIIDNTAPELTFVRPSEGEVVSELVDVAIEAMDPAGIASISSSGMTVTSTSLSYVLDTELLPFGSHLLSAIAVDGAIVDGGLGANTATATVTITIDNRARAPRITLTPGDGDAAFGLTTIEAAVTSPLGRPIDRVEVSVDGQPLSVTGNSSPYTAQYDFSLHPRSSALIEAIAYDDAGRPGTATVTVSVTGPPVFRITPQRALANGFSNDGYDVGDVTGDGVADVVAGGSALQVLTGTISASGDWSPSPPVVSDATNGADRVRLIDTDSDGDRDLITLLGNEIRLYLNDGGLPSIPDVSAELQQFNSFAFLATGDIDADGDADVLLSGPGGVDLVVVRNAANGAFAFDERYGLVANVTDLALGDVDEDGDLDVVIGRSGNSNVITTYRNDGTGAFGAGQDSFTTGAAQYVAIGDVSGDGFPDVVTVIPSLPGINPVTGGLALLTGAPGTPGTFVQGQVDFLPPGSREVLVSDLNGDGALDVLVNTYQANGVEELANLGGGVFPARANRSQFVIARRPVQPRLWDLDGDGDLDYLAISSSDQTLAFAENLGLGNLFAAPVITPAAAPRAIAAGNVYGNGQDDFVLAFSENGPVQAGISIWENIDGDVFPRGQVEIGDGISTPTSLSIGDLDGIGLLDIAVGSNANGADMTTMDGSAVLLLNDGDASFRTTHLDLLRPIDALIADADNDGVGEAIFTFDDQQAAFEGSEIWDVSTGTPLLLRQWSEGLGARALAAGDLAADAGGFLDYVVANGTSNDITVSLWDGIGGWNTTTYTALPGIIDVAIGFVGNDQYGDILAVGSPGLVVMEGRSGNGFAQPVTWPAGAMPSKLATGDFNADGLTDVMVLNGSNRVSVLIGRPQGGFFPPIAFPVGDVPVDFVTTDFNGDGRGDLAVACTGVPAVVLVYSSNP